MVRTRRRITNEQERLGGFNVSPNVSFTGFDDEIEEEEPVVTFSRRQPPYEERKRPEVVAYSGRPAVYPQTSEYAAPVTAPQKAPKPVRREREELMPSIKTRAYAGEEAEKEKHAREKDAKSSSKSKAVLGLYMAVVTVLAIVVIATGIAVSGIRKDVGALEETIDNRNRIVAEQSAQIDKLTDPAFVAGIALGQGMEKVDSAVEVDLAPVTEPIEYESRSNWFDRFCDWLSNIIGG